MHTLFSRKATQAFSAIVLALAIVGVSLAPSVGAQNANTGLAISPPSFELSANPGDTLTNSIRVDNLTDRALDVTVDKRNFTALGEEGQVNLTEEGSRFSLSSWITVAQQTANVGARSSQTFAYTIKVPANAEPGSRFGSVVFRTTAQPVEGQSGVAVGQEIASLVFVRIAGQVVEKSAITQFATGSNLYEGGPVDFDTRVRNEGNVTFRPAGTITITNFFGDKVATIPVESRNVLPDAVRRMAAEWQGSRIVIGKYTATVSLVYGSDNKILTSSTTFYGFPVRLAIVAVAVLAVLGFIVWRGRKRIRLALRALSGKH